MSAITSLDVTRPVVHLCVDPQEQYIRYLSPARQSSFPRDIRTFADALRPRIPTIWIAFGASKAFRTHERLQPWPTENVGLRRQYRWCSYSLVNRLELTTVRPKQDEPILEKGSVDAFASSDLQDFLPNNAQLIFSGMNTTACVFSTVFHASLLKYDCYIVCDRLADGNLRPCNDMLSSYHRTKLEKMLFPVPSSVRFTHAQEILDHIETWPSHNFYRPKASGLISRAKDAYRLLPLIAG
ncbi:MAG: isochorismatase family protein [Bdellovibrionales bacterium]